MVGGVAPSGESRILPVRRDERGLVLGGEGIALPCQPVALDLRHGLMGIWLADGRVLAAECERLEALPEFREFESVGTQPANQPDPFLAVLADRRVSLSFHSGQSMQFRANGNGQWERQAPTGRLELSRIEVQRPSRIGAALEVRGAAMRMQAAAERVWAAHGVSGAQPFWENLLGGR